DVYNRSLEPGPRGRSGEDVLRPAQPARRKRGGELRSLPAQDQDPSKGPEGRLPSVRAQLLPALPSGRALPRAGRYLDLPRRLPLRGSGAAGGRLTAARVREPVDTAPGHVGCRCVVRVKPEGA